MSTLKTNNLQHLDSGTANIELAIGGGAIHSGISTFQSGVRVTGGSVGIGTDNPSFELSIYGTDSVRNEIVCTNNNSAGAGIYLRTMNGGSTVSNATIATNASGTLSIFTGNSAEASERLRITSSGITSVTGSLAVNGNNYPTVGPLSNRNLIINGAMQVAQRGTSGTANDYNSIDRFGRDVNSGTGTFTDTQQTLTSGSPYDEGFRKFFRIASSSASTAGTWSYLQIYYKAEAQDIAASGWKYTDTSSYVTLSFWVRASVTQTYGFSVQTQDGTQYLYNKTFALSANTWTKITQSIPGRSGLQFDNDSNLGLTFKWFPHLGSTYNGGTDNTWDTVGSGNYGSSLGTAWWTASSATFDLTGVQLELGTKATPFEYRSYGDELARCQRYYQKITSHTTNARMAIGGNGSVAGCFPTAYLPTTMRAQPSVSYSALSDFNTEGITGGGATQVSALSFNAASSHAVTLSVSASGGSSSGTGGQVLSNNTNAYLAFSAEL